MRAELSARRKAAMLAAAALALPLIMLFCMTRGSYPIPAAEVLRVFASRLSHAGDSNYEVIVWEIRLPRILLAALGGMGLAMAGAVFQGVFRNPLVEPYILGVSSGAAFGAAAAIVFFSGALSVSLAAFLCAVAAMITAYAVATRHGQTPLVNLILAGVIVSSVFSSGLNFIKTMAPDSALREISFWLMGGFYTAEWGEVALLAPCALAALALLTALGWRLNVLSMGDEEAASLGVRVGLLKLVLLGAATFVTSLIVSRVGVISWVGLMVPHAARMLIGPDHRYAIPFSALLGACFLVICDTLARTLIMGEIPVSIITSVLGAPYLVYLLRTNRQTEV